MFYLTKGVTDAIDSEIYPTIIAQTTIIAIIAQTKSCVAVVTVDFTSKAVGEHIVQCGVEEV